MATRKRRKPFPARATSIRTFRHPARGGDWHFCEAAPKGEEEEEGSHHSLPLRPVGRAAADEIRLAGQESDREYCVDNAFSHRSALSVHSTRHETAKGIPARLESHGDDAGERLGFPKPS